MKIPTRFFVKNNVICINHPSKTSLGFIQRHYVVNERTLRLFKAFGFHIDPSRELIVTEDHKIYSMFPIY